MVEKDFGEKLFTEFPMSHESQFILDLTIDILGKENGAKSHILLLFLRHF